MPTSRDAADKRVEDAGSALALDLLRAKPPRKWASTRKPAAAAPAKRKAAKKGTANAKLFEGRKTASKAKKAAEEAVNNAAKYGKPEEKAVSTAAMVIGLKVTLLPTPFVQAEKVLNVDTESYAFPRTDRRRYLVTVYEP